MRSVGAIKMIGYTSGASITNGNVGLELFVHIYWKSHREEALGATDTRSWAFNGLVLSNSARLERALRPAASPTHPNPDTIHDERKFGLKAV